MPILEYFVAKIVYICILIFLVAASEVSSMKLTEEKPLGDQDSSENMKEDDDLQAGVGLWYSDSNIAASPSQPAIMGNLVIEDAYFNRSLPQLSSVIGADGTAANTPLTKSEEVESPGSDRFSTPFVDSELISTPKTSTKPARKQFTPGASKAINFSYYEEDEDDTSSATAAPKTPSRQSTQPARKGFTPASSTPQVTRLSADPKLKRALLNENDVPIEDFDEEDFTAKTAKVAQELFSMDIDLQKPGGAVDLSSGFDKKTSSELSSDLAITPVANDTTADNTYKSNLNDLQNSNNDSSVLSSDFTPRPQQLSTVVVRSAGSGVISPNNLAFSPNLPPGANIATADNPPDLSHVVSFGRVFTEAGEPNFRRVSACGVELDDITALVQSYVGPIAMNYSSLLASCDWILTMSSKTSDYDLMQTPPMLRGIISKDVLKILMKAESISQLKALLLLHLNSSSVGSCSVLWKQIFIALPKCMPIVLRKLKRRHQRAITQFWKV